MTTPFFKSLDNLQQGFATSVCDAYVAAYHGHKPPPVVLSGAGGTGKTTSVAAALELIREWLRQRHASLMPRRMHERMTPQMAREMVRAAPNDQVKLIFKSLAVSAVAPKESASDRKDAELLAQAEAIAFAVLEEVNDEL